MKAIFKSIQSICDEARRALDDPELSRDQLLSALSVRMMSQLARIPETLIAVLTATLFHPFRLFAVAFCVF